MVRSRSVEAKDGSLKRRRGVVQELLEGLWLGFDRLCTTRCSRHTAVVARAGKSSGQVLAREIGVAGIGGKRSPDDLSVSKESGILPRDGVVGVGIRDLDDVLTISSTSALTSVSSLSVSTWVAIVVSV